MVLDDILSSYPEIDFLMAEGFDEAVIGFDYNEYRLIYSVRLCVEILLRDGMTYEDALDYLSYNTFNAYVGDQTPIWCYDIL